ncbi:MAG: nucleotide exchange factor GrpE [Chloroflexi bacterium]|nr:nucleotide exchange factor GrpE [Chloroflexota bacterium]|tara:strand:+ start:907 stop:1416 length:510 start_codon:yes stop_codon:yes gene_type:complete
MSKKKNTKNESKDKNLNDLNNNQNESLLEDINTYKSLAQRSQADLVNYRKRVEIEQLELRNKVKEQIILKFLEIIDQLDVALKHKTLDESWISGIDAIYKNFQNILLSEGYEKFESKGEIFDPRKHEALLSTIDKSLDVNTVINQIRCGYIRGDHVVRPAQVEISKLEE